MTFEELDIGEMFMFASSIKRGVLIKYVKVTLDGYYAPLVHFSGSLLCPEASEVVATDEFFEINLPFFQLYIDALKRHTEEKLKRRQKRLGIANFYETFKKLDG